MLSNTGCGATIVVRAIILATHAAVRAAHAIPATRHAHAVAELFKGNGRSPKAAPLTLHSSRAFAKTIIMKKLLALYRHFSDKRYSTIAGTLVYFLLMSLAPTLLWLALIVGKIDFQSFTSHAFFEAIEPFLTYLNRAAQNAASGAGIILLATSLYSSTNFFYHLRRSGEIIYDSDHKKGGLKLRLAAAGIVVAAIIGFALVATVIIAGENMLFYFMPAVIVECIQLVCIVGIAFFIAILLNIFACPFKLNFSGALCGSLLTTALWLIFAAGFTVYMRFANPSQLYGAAATIIIFLLWCYIMISSLVVGIIYNSMLVAKQRAKPLYS